MARWIRIIALLLLALACLAPATGADTPSDGLRPGEFAWTPDVAPGGPVTIIVSLPEQRAHVYRNGVRIGVSTVSTGKEGHETPTGIYTILQKRREHYSNLYDNAPMPFMQRLTWTGIALHAGHLPGYPASHGCVRLPKAFAEQLFAVTAHGTVVVVADAAAFPPAVAAPGLFSPVDPAGALRVPVPDAFDAPGTAWHPGRAPGGPLTVLVGLADQRVVVLRNGIEIGHAPLTVRDAPPVGTRAWLLLEGAGDGADPVLPDRPARRWLALPTGEVAPGDADALGEAFADGRIAMPAGFARRVHDALRPGATVIVTDGPLESATTPVDVLEQAETR
ncbi:L,D-transpeptidase [Luteimonas pelagia]